MSIPRSPPAEFWPWPWNEVFAPPPEEPGWKQSLVSFPDEARSRHFAIYGGTGVGKSRFLEWIITVDAIKRIQGISPRGVGLIDVHGDLYRNIRARFALTAQEFPVLEDLVFLIDPLKTWWFKYDPLRPGPGELVEDRASMLADMITTIYRDDPQVVNRMRWLLYHAFLTLSLAGLSLKHFLPLMRDRGFRESLVSDLDHTELTAYWLDEFPRTDNEAMRWAESSLDRIGPLVTDPRVCRILEGPGTNTFREFLDDGAVVLVHAPIGKLGRGKAYLFCAFILAEFQKAAIYRADLPENERRPFSLFCDEFQNYTTDSILQIIKESRKYRLELGLATQEIRGQPKDESLRRSVLKNVGNIMSFRLDYDDAELLVKEVFTPDLDQAKDVRIRYQKIPGPFGEFNQRFEDVVYRPIQEIWENEVRKLTELPDRCLWWKRRGESGSNLMRTGTVLDLEDIPNSQQIPDALKKQELATYMLASKTKKKGEILRLPKPRQDGHLREHQELIFDEHGKEPWPDWGW